MTCDTGEVSRKLKKLKKTNRCFVLYENLIRFALLLLSSGAVLLHCCSGRDSTLGG
jgi:protein tyrosine/serine phosphatase